METSEIRKLVLQMLERAKRRSLEHRSQADNAQRAYDALLPNVATAWRQVANALRVEGHAFTVHTPSSALRFASDRSADDFIELSLDTSRRPAALWLQVRLARGHRVIERELILAEGEAVAGVTEEQLIAALLDELEPFVQR
ncbi:MAG: hypothetical protein AB7I50_08160 [Vicinamibacterales bacterium]